MPGHWHLESGHRPPPHGLIQEVKARALSKAERVPRSCFEHRSVQNARLSRRWQPPLRYAGSRLDRLRWHDVAAWSLRRTGRIVPAGFSRKSWTAAVAVPGRARGSFRRWVRRNVANLRGGQPDLDHDAVGLHGRCARLKRRDRSRAQPPELADHRPSETLCPGRADWPRDAK
jgi:hypothetical protein